MVTRDGFRQAMGKFATGVTVVTTVDHQGEVHGMTANSFTSVCLEPPVVLVCIAHGTHTYGYVEARGRFGVNVVSAQQQAIAQYYARPPEEREGDAGCRFSTSAAGVPILEGAMVSLVCRVVGSHVYGDHTVYMGEVEEVRMGDPAVPLLFYDSRWNTSIESEA